MSRFQNAVLVPVQRLHQSIVVFGGIFLALTLSVTQAAPVGSISATPAARRLIAGGTPPQTVHYFYTDDHYATFRRIQD